jgi:hypothetical protein
MFSISDTESELLFDAAQLEVQRLRDECQDTKLELRRHGAGHQPGEKSKAAGSSGD